MGEINIQNNNGELLVSSREVADNFGKRKADVIKAIEEHIEDLDKSGNAKVRCQMFRLSTYINRGKQYKEYLMDRDGFSLLVMSFNNIKGVLEWKLKYINAFNEMEKQLKNGVGSYLIEDPIKRAEQWIIEQKEKQALQLENSQKTQIIGELKPKADYTDTILDNDSVINITQIAKDYGKSASELNNILHGLGVQFKQGTQWFLYSKYHDKGYTHSKTYDVKRSDGSAEPKLHTKWTQKGRLFIYNLLKDNGIVPLIEYTLDDILELE